MSNSLNCIRFSRHLKDFQRVQLTKYLELLLEYNKNVNLISRQISINQVVQLLDESMMLNPFISFNEIIDVGSGNGLIGIPLAILNKEKRVVLVEKRQKKINFLLEIKKYFQFLNLSIEKKSIEVFIKESCKKRDKSIVARGFPDLELLTNFLINGFVNEIVLITSEKKIRKIKKGMESVIKKTYNIPMRNNLIIVKMEHVSRETNQKQM